MIIPRNVVLKDRATSPAIMNFIRKELGGSYAQKVPKVANNVESVREVGNIIVGDMELANAFIPALANRIGRVVIQSKLYHNPLERFKLGYMELGDVVEEIFVNLLKPHAFDPDEASEKWMRREKPNVDSVFHKINFQAFYKITISYQELRTAFLTWSGLHDLVGRIIEQAYTSANWDEFIMFKYLVASAIIQNQLFPVTVPVPAAATAKEITTEMVARSNDLIFMSNDYNAMGVNTYTDKDDQLMLINTKFSAIQDVEVLAQAFNMEKAELQGHVIMMNGFTFSKGEQERLSELATIIGKSYPQFTEDQLTTLGNVPAVLLDESFFIVIDQLFEMRNQENGEGLYWQYWLHTWKLFSWSPFSNAIVFTTDTNGITAVSVTPKTATVAKGASATFKANVTVTGLAPQTVLWSVTGSDPVTSTITADGVLTVAPDEANTSLTVTAASTYDGTKTATATVTVS